MKTLFDFLYDNQLLHWAAALAGIISLLLVRVFRVKGFSWKVWVHENLIGLIWSLFFLSLTVTLTAVYVDSYTLTEAFLTGYSGAHVIFRLNKEPKNHTRPTRLFNRHQSR
jgi:hypothetical protein